MGTAGSGAVRNDTVGGEFVGGRDWEQEMDSEVKRQLTCTVGVVDPSLGKEWIGWRMRRRRDSWRRKRKDSVRPLVAGVVALNS